MKRWNRIRAVMIVTLMFTRMWNAVAELELEMPQETEGIEAVIGMEDGEAELEVPLEFDNALELDNLNLTQTIADDLLVDPKEVPVPTRKNDSASDFNINENGMLVKYTGPGGDVAIPDGVKQIGSEAFNGCKSLTSVTIPSSVTKICDGNTNKLQGAFHNCTKLKQVTFSNGLIYIGENAF